MGGSVQRECGKMVCGEGVCVRSVCVTMCEECVWVGGGVWREGV